MKILRILQVHPNFTSRIFLFVVVSELFAGYLNLKNSKNPLN